MKTGSSNQQMLWLRGTDCQAANLRKITSHELSTISLKDLHRRLQFKNHSVLLDLRTTNNGREYFVATDMIYILCLLNSQVWTLFKNGLGHTAQLALTGTGKVQVTVPITFSWKSGQNIYIRFLTLGLHSFTSHPFTICSLAPQPHQTDRSKSELVLYIRPRGGFLRWLAALANKQPDASLRVILV